MTCKESYSPIDPLLVVNAAEQRLQIVLGKDSLLLHCREFISQGNLTQLLVPAVKESLSSLGIALSDLSGIACVRGPGSFTGLRVALATILGIARGLSLPMAGIDYLPLLAAAPCSIFTGEVWVLTYARQNLVFIQGFSCPQNEPLIPASSLSLQDAAILINSRESDTILIGSGVRKNLQFWSTHAPQSKIAADFWDFAHPDTLLFLASKAEFKDGPISPLYLRPSEAEENLKQIAQKRGITLEKASSLLPGYNDRR